MSYADEFFALTNKKTKKMSYEDEFFNLIAKQESEDKEIAPVLTRAKTTKEKEAEKEKGFEFFKKSSGNVAQAILGTVGDIGLNVAKGAGSLVEGLVDLADYGIAEVADLVGASDFADAARGAAKENLIDRFTKNASEQLEKYSVLGDTSEAIAQGLGQVGGIILTGGAGAAAGLGTTGATLLTSGVMGLSSAGSGMSEAYAEGATDEEAATYGLIKGVVDAGSEMIFGGLGKTVKAIGLSKGLSSLDDIFAKKLTNKIANQTAKNFIQFGVKASAEGVEEVLAGLGTAVGKKLTYMSKKELKELIDNEDLLEQFVVGTVTSGIAQSGIVPGMQQGSLREANKTGTDFIDGLTENEQKVVDAEFEKRTEGKDLTKREQNKIYEDVLGDMAKGYISTDTIESVLGGDTYKTYKDTIDNKKALQDEYDALYKMKNGEKSDEQIDRQADLKKQLEELNKTDTNELKTRLGEEVLGIVKDSRLAESYNEKGRRSQAFEADVSKYDEKQRVVVQKAIDSGVLNNTNRTHDFVDWIAAISSGKDLNFDFVNNKKLRESGFALNGKTVDGYVTKDGVVLNIDSNKSLNIVVGHEITHVLEGTKYYPKVQRIVTELAKTKGEYQSKYDALLKLYEGIEGADINAELTAELVGEYLFTDTDFIKNLSVNHRNVFQKIYDEIKYLCKVATAGSKEARELERVKRAFEKAYRESGTKSELEAKPIEAQNVDTKTNDKYGVIENLLSKSSVNNTLANEIIRDADLSKAFTDITGVTLEGTTEQKREIIRKAVRDYQVRGTENEALARAAAEEAQFEQVLRDSGYSSYIRGIFKKGATVEDAKEILGNAELKAEWEAITQKELPANEKSAIKMIVQTKRNADRIGLPNIDAKYSLTDANYSDAVNRGDMKTAQKMVDEAAKAAGYTEKLYHGTDRFGFTKIETEGLETGIEWSPFWAATREDMSGTYTAMAKTRDIANGFTADDLDEMSAQLSEEMDDAIDDFRYLIDRTFSEWYFGQRDNSYIRELVDEANWEAGFGDGVYDVLDEIVSDAYYEYEDDFSDEYEDFDDWQENSDEAQKIYDAVEAIEGIKRKIHEFDWGENTGGIYALYANTDNLFTVDAKGAIWKNLRPEGLPQIETFYSKDAPYKTRDVAKWAKDNGYSGVRFKNIRDNGQYGLAPAGDVYVFFDPQAQIKSADTVTYDNDGNVIPLSERFKMNNPDIRYSLSAEGEETATVGKFLAADLRLEAPAGTVENEIAPVKETAKQNAAQPTAKEKQQIAKILSEEPTKSNRKNRNWAMFKAAVLDKGAVFEDLSFKTKNRSLMEKWNYILSSEGRAQHLIGNGDKGVKSLVEILDNVQDNEKPFAEYLYHKHNIDRMTLEERFEGATNKAVFGDAVTAAESREIVRRSEKNNPEFKKYAEEVYKYNRHLRQLLVESGVISQETADLWEKMYPHYVPISRVMDNDTSIYVPLDTRRTGVNAPVKKAKGGNQDMRPVYTVMASRTLQTFKAIAKNNFGIELKNTLQSAIGNEVTQVDDVLNSLSDEESLLQRAKNGKNPTFTVFENGERVTFEVSEDMYDALKPVSEKLAMTIKPLNVASKLQRGLLTEYNPVFMLTNAIKDAQDVLINSQHPLKTYSKMPEAFKQIVTEGYWYEEYMKSGGEDNTYFNKQTGEFEAEKKGAAKILESFPFNFVSSINNVIERIPRLAEYIVSRESGKSVEGAMLDAARVTTNFAAGGDFAKFLNRNGATFFNASIQGAMQQARNIREANANGIKGWVGLATRFAMAGIPALILNNLVWDDDEEYEELSDYVKQNYYVVYKTDDGRFIRIPKGRTLAVIQNAIEQVANAATGDDEADLAEFLKLAAENLAPNSPMDNNVLSPIAQAVWNKTWYGEDLVPTRLQELPAAEQYDESTDSLSKWLGEKLDISPYKINYLLDQYSGGIGDVLLPMMTPEAESGDTSRLGQLIAPLRDKFTTDATFNNQNVSDFYDKVKELTTNAKASAATDEDILKNKYMNAVNSEVSDLYKKKREIQNSNLSDTAKYKQVKDVQKQITDIMRDALGTYDNIRYENGKEFAIIGDTYFQWYKPEDGDAYWRKLSEDQVIKHKVTYAAGDVAYATNGKVHYRLNEGGDWRNISDWTKISDKDLARQKEVTKELGITPEEYWGNTDVAYHPVKTGEYEYAYDNPETYAVAKAVGGYDAYKNYSEYLFNYQSDKYIGSDKDANGNSISNSRKPKVVAYINGLNIDYGEKLILYKSVYNGDDTYNYEIINYLNNRDDLSYDDMVNILTKLSFKVDGKGNISWD